MLTNFFPSTSEPEKANRKWGRMLDLGGHRVDAENLYGECLRQYDFLQINV